MFHASVVLFILATQVMYTPARDLGPDNTWHYRMAKDLVSGVPFFWAGLDGNRLFPDLLFAVGAYVLSGDALFAAWLAYFYCLFLIAVYASLLAIGAALYEEIQERRAFALVSLAALWLFSLAAPFWARWFLDPGNHGTGLPVAFVCLALVLWMLKERSFSVPGALTLFVCASLLVGSNRFLLLGFLLPLIAAVAALLAARWNARRLHPAATAQSGARVLVLLLATLAATVLGGYLAYKGLSALPWHKSMTYMGVSAFGHGLSLGWAAEKFGKEMTDFARYVAEFKLQVALGPLLMLASVPISLALWRRAARERTTFALDDNLVLFGVFCAASSLLSIAFVIWGWDENSEWRYRYLAMPIAFALAFLPAFVAPRVPSFGRPGWLSTGTLVVLIGLTAIPSFSRERYERAARNETFLAQVAHLKQLIAAHTHAAARKGYGEYWMGMDTGPRAGLRIDVLDSKGQFEFYSNNAGTLCTGGYSFVARKVEPDAPKRAVIVSVLGEPDGTDQVEIEGHGKVEVMYYDPALLQARITDPGKKAARERFPSFRCAH